jgi:SAM-dependent methyltransferase
MSSTAIVIRAGRGGRPLLQTADSVLRSGRAPALTLITLSTADSAPLVDAVIARLDAATVDTPYDPLNGAIRAIDAKYLLFLHAGYMLDEVFLERCEDAFADDASIAAIVPPVRLQTADATAYLEWKPAATTAVSVLNDTRSVPAVFGVRHDVWETLGGFDASFDELAEYEFWLRLTLAGHQVGVLDEALIARDITVAADNSARNDGGPAFTAGQSQDPRLRRFRAVLEKHAGAIEKVMHEVVVAREVRFGQLREVHRDLTTRRDAGLAELGRLRAEAAHLRAYLTHHARAAIDWGDLRHTEPISRDWGYDRGVPIDRRYIDDFVAAHSSDVRGSVLEVQEPEYTRACGGPRVTASSVLDIDASNPRATVVADLRNARNIAAEQFDCIILTQTLHVIDDMGAALRECHRILKPGGVLLATVPAASRVCLEYGRDGDLWRMTPAGARLLFRSAFAPSTVTTSEFGNVLTNVAFLHGAATAELSDAEFEARDPYFVAVTGVRAKKGSLPPRRGARGLVLLYHRIEENWDAHDLAVPPALFEAQLAWLRREYNVLPLVDVLASPAESLPERAVALTFDDGYVDSLTTVAPLLQKYDLPATFLLTTRWRRERGEYWWDLLERVMLSTRRLRSRVAV